MKTIIAIGFVLLLFALSDSLSIHILSIIYLIISFLVELYVLGNEQEPKN